MKAIKLFALLVATVVLSAAAAAAERPPSTGVTSGPAAGTPVLPSTVVQKGNPFVVGLGRQNLCWQSDAAAGAPGVPAAVGTQGGAAAGSLSKRGK